MLKIVVTVDKKGMAIRFLTVVLNSIIPPMSAFVLSKVVFFLGEKSFETAVIYLCIYLALMISWRIYARYSGNISAGLNEKLITKLQGLMVDLHRDIPLDIVESSDFIKLRERGNVFLNTYALRFFGTTERLVTIAFTIINYLILFFNVHFAFVLIVIAASLPGFLARAKFVPEMRKMYEDLQEDRGYQGYYKNMLTSPSAVKELRVWGLESEFYSRYHKLKNPRPADESLLPARLSRRRR